MTCTHHWVVDAQALGKCKHCGETHQFSNRPPGDYADTKSAKFGAGPYRRISHEEAKAIREGKAHHSAVLAYAREIAHDYTRRY